MDETARKFEEAMAWLREQDALTDDVRAQFAEMLPWLPKSAQDGLWRLAHPGIASLGAERAATAGESGWGNKLLG